MPAQTANDAPPNAVRILTYPIDETLLKKLGNRRRNQLFGSMHAHNELSFLNRLLLFTQNSTADGELHDQAQSIQMWCVLQLLAGKLFETWHMLVERILRAKPADPILSALDPDHQASLIWLRDYFGDRNWKDSVIKLVRDKTAFHYEGLDMGQAVNNLAARENTVHLAEHPANTLYYLGSAIGFRTIFVLVADRAKSPAGRSFDERLSDGFGIVVEDVKAANWHIHQVLYGLIKAMMEEAVGGPLGEAPEATTISNAPVPDIVGLPPWIDIRRLKS
jgi:hypothetical protein